MTPRKVDWTVIGAVLNKVLAADVTGDQIVDLVLGYHLIGMVTIEQGDGSGNFSHLAMNNFSHEDRELHPDDSVWSEPQVHNLSAADLNGDGHLDFVTANYREKSLSIVRGNGDGTFQQAVTIPKGLRSYHREWIRSQD